MDTHNTDSIENETYRIYDASSLGHAIRHFRKEAGLTQAELAERTGLNRQYVIDMEQGLETEQLRRLLRTLRVLGVRMTLGRRDW